jgi:hypothetical protein
MRLRSPGIEPFAAKFTEEIREEIEENAPWLFG